MIVGDTTQPIIGNKGLARPTALLRPRPDPQPWASEPLGERGRRTFQFADIHSDPDTYTVGLPPILENLALGKTPGAGYKMRIQADVLPKVTKEVILKQLLLVPPPDWASTLKCSNAAP